MTRETASLLLGCDVDYNPATRLMTGPSYAIKLSLEWSILNVLCEYGVACVGAMAIRGTLPQKRKDSRHRM